MALLLPFTFLLIIEILRSHPSRRVSRGSHLNTETHHYHLPTKLHGVPLQMAIILQQYEQTMQFNVVPQLFVIAAIDGLHQLTLSHAPMFLRLLLPSLGVF